MSIGLESIQVLVQHCLNQYCYRDATFLAEVLFAHDCSEENAYLLAGCYFKCQQLMKTFHLLGSRSLTHLPSKFLYVRCCYELQKYDLAENAILGCLSDQKSLDVVQSEYGEYSGAIFQILGEIYRRSLHLSPFLWSSFEGLCKLGDETDISVLFSYNENNASNTISADPNTNKSSNEPVLNPSSPIPSENCPYTSTQSCEPMDTSPTQVNESWFDSSQNTSLFSIRPLISSVKKSATCALRTLAPSYIEDQQVMTTIGTPMPSQRIDLKPGVKKNPRHAHVKSAVLSQAYTNVDVQCSRNTSIRKPRNFSSHDSIKENATSPSKPSRKLSKPDPNLSVSDMNKNPPSSKENTYEKRISRCDEKRKERIKKCIVFNSKQIEEVLKVLKLLAAPYQKLHTYECKLAIELFDSLPLAFRQMSWVIRNKGIAYFELNNYEMAVTCFEELRRLYATETDGLEYYSSALWHLKNDALLSALAHELIESNRKDPVSWCAAGNCFSLQKEHETAIKMFQRAIQLQPDYLYSYTLLGNEYIIVEDFDQAMACFRTVLNQDKRNYRAWYGIGHIYFNQENFSSADVYFKRALEINAASSVLLCHVAVVQHIAFDSNEALSVLDVAILSDPKNTLCRFHRAGILYATGRLNEALQELDRLKRLAPKESLVYYLMSKVFRRLNNQPMYLLHMSWAIDLDPKGAHNSFKETIDKFYSYEDDTALSSDLSAATASLMEESETMPQTTEASLEDTSSAGSIQDLTRDDGM